ncbi:MAG: radical SAM protein, partial [Erysipelotrichaceae bacterium]|nr:radical SAM protein [Erysipelotrichaceae bacterium]
MMTRIDHLYVHVPFCRTICAYCDFCHAGYREDLADRWLDRLEEDINEIKDEAYSTVYVGGGTPTALGERQLERLLGMLERFTGSVKEYTFEVNPETLTEEKADLLKRYGVNRISIGLQSSDKRLLKLM